MKLSLFRAASEAPNRTALVIDGRSFTFTELAGRVRMLLPEIRRHLGEAARAAVVGELDLATLEVIYGLIDLGRPVLLLHPSSSQSERQRLLDAAAPAGLLDPAEIKRDVLATLPPPAMLPDDDRPLAIVPTSGSTNGARGVVLSREAFVSSAEASAQNLGWEEEDRWLLSLPVGHIGGLSILMRCLVGRHTLVVHRVPRFDPEEIARVIEEQHITLLSLVPTTLRRLLDLRPEFDPPSFLRAVLVGGAAVPPALREEAVDRGWPILTTYGLTEACSQVATQPYILAQSGQTRAGAPPLPGIEVRVRDEIIEVRGPQLLSAYLGEEENPLDADGWFQTGDLGRLDEDGWLHVLGRRDGIIVTGGENVLATEVEAALEEHEAIEAACVFGLDDAAWGEAVTAVLVATAAPPADGELIAHLAERLARYKIPRRIAYLDTMPRLPTGKLDRRGAAAAAGDRPRELVRNA